MPLQPHPYHVYIVKCADDSLYTGVTNNLERRLRQHNKELRGGAKYTRSRGPVELVYAEKFVTRTEATKREWEIKHTMDHRTKVELIGRATKDGVDYKHL